MFNYIEQSYSSGPFSLQTFQPAHCPFKDGHHTGPQCTADWPQILARMSLALSTSGSSSTCSTPFPTWQVRCCLAMLQSCHASVETCWWEWSPRSRWLHPCPRLCTHQGWWFCLLALLLRTSLFTLIFHVSFGVESYSSREISVSSVYG